MTLWIAPRFRSRRVVSDGGLILTVAYDLTCFIRFFECHKRCSENAWMRLSIVRSIRSRRAVLDGGLILSVAYDLMCSITFFKGYEGCLENAWMRLSIVRSIRSRPVFFEFEAKKSTMKLPIPDLSPSGPCFKRFVLKPLISISPIAKKYFRHVEYDSDSPEDRKYKAL